MIKDVIMHIGDASMRYQVMTKPDWPARITASPRIYGGKPIIRGMRMAAEHVLGMLDAGGSRDAILEAYPYLEREDIEACLVVARRPVGRE
jgi:uncharacterized protein (DUF433 family)